MNTKVEVNLSGFQHYDHAKSVSDAISELVLGEGETCRANYSPGSPSHSVVISVPVSGLVRLCDELIEQGFLTTE